MNQQRRRPYPAVAAIVIRNSEILLIRRGNAPGRGKWSIPGGSVEWGETMEQAVKREVLEETGLVVEVGELAGIGDLIVRKGKAVEYDYILINYFAAVVSGELHAATDALEARWVPFSELPTLDLTASLVHRLKGLGIM